MSEHLRVYREEGGLSQEEVAEQLKITRQTLSNWENGKTAPDTSSLAALAQLYGKTVDALLYGTPEEEAEKQPETQSEEPPADTPEIVPEAPPAVRNKPSPKVVVLAALAVLLALAISFAAGWYAHAYVQSHTVNERQVDLSEPHDTLEFFPVEGN